MKVTFVTGRAGSSLLILTGVTAEVSESSKVKSAEVKSSKVTVAAYDYFRRNRRRASVPS